MSLITPEWRIILTDHINRKYKTALKPSALLFEHNRYYTPVADHRIIDVLPADDTLIGRGTLYIVPWDPAKYFKNTPVVIYPEDDLTGSALIDIIGQAYGIHFDKVNDIEPSFLDSTIAVGTEQTVSIPFRDKSFVWSGKLDIVIGNGGLHLPSAVRVRDLSGLITPDIIDPATQSLRLLTAPIVITDPVLVRKFSGSEPVTMEGEALDRLMIEIEEQLIVDDSDLGGLRDLFTGVDFIQVESHDTDYDRYMTTVDPLKNDKFSGKPRFKFKSVIIEDDINSVVGEIVIADLPNPDSLKMTTFFVATGDYKGSYLPNLLMAQAELYPERAEAILEVISATWEGDGVFASMDRSKAYEQLSTGQVTVYLDTTESSRWHGRLAITFPMPTFALEDESQRDLETEDGTAIINLEHKYIVLYTQDGDLSQNDLGTAISGGTLGEVSLFGMMLYANAGDGSMPYLKPTVIATPIEDGNIYTEPSWPNVEVHAKPPVY